MREATGCLMGEMRRLREVDVEIRKARFLEVSKVHT